MIIFYKIYKTIIKYTVYKKEDAIKIVKKMLKGEEEILDKIEIQSAPSGE